MVTAIHQGPEWPEVFVMKRFITLVSQLRVPPGSKHPCCYALFSFCVLMTHDTAINLFFLLGLCRLRKRGSLTHTNYFPMPRALPGPSLGLLGFPG